MAQQINRCLNKQMLDLCQRAYQLDELNSKLKAFLPSPLIDHCLVASFERGCLLISVSNASWATELRYRIPELRDLLRKEGLYQLVSIKIMIAELDQKAVQQKPSKQTKLSETARSSLRKAGELCSYEPLKEALALLADSD
jgi:hypothetical protein